MQFLRGLIIIVGLAMTIAGCYFVLIGAGVPLQELGFGLGEFRLSTGNLSAGVIFSVFGILLIFIAVQFFKKKETDRHGGSKQFYWRSP